jgi:hypothetical protein
MSRIFRDDILAIKKLFPFVPFSFRSITTVNSYEEILHIIKTFFEINKDHFEILSFGERETDLVYCEEQMLNETTITVKCNPISKPLDEDFIKFCGEYKNNENQEKNFNQYKEDYNKAIEKDDMGRNALEFHMYIREFSFINAGGEKSTVNIVEFNYITKLRTKLFEIMYKKMKGIFEISRDLFISKMSISENLTSDEQYKISYDGELFEDVRIQCLIPFMRKL